MDYKEIGKKQVKFQHMRFHLQNLIAKRHFHCRNVYGQIHTTHLFIRELFLETQLRFRERVLTNLSYTRRLQLLPKGPKRIQQQLATKPYEKNPFDSPAT